MQVRSCFATLLNPSRGRGLAMALAVFLVTAAALAQPGPTTRGDDLTPEQRASIEMMVIDSPPHPRKGLVRASYEKAPLTAVLLPVPTSTWTYGCSATAAGMIFGYYDRNGYPNMYTGPTNGGVCPLINLGQGDNPASPIAGACSIIATMNGFDGRSTYGHVDDYWVSYDTGATDPWVSRGTEHTWGDCTADYMGTNQWKWDFNPTGAPDGTIDANSDGSTTFFNYTSGARLYDYIPPAAAGTPQTAGCHGTRLFAESRGYTVTANFNQYVDTYAPSGGFTINDYKAEIDAGRPVLIHIEGHTMTGVGYDTADATKIYIHDTWDNVLHSMTWGGYYDGSEHMSVTVIRLAAGPTPTTSFSSAQSSYFTSTGHFFAAAYSSGMGFLGAVDTYYTGTLGYAIYDGAWTSVYIYDYALARYTRASYGYFD